ncbi:glutamyl-tRNA reductase [Jatrophihabitans sp. DSM 45814]
MRIVSLSVSHRSAPIEVLERLAVPSADLGHVSARLHAEPPIDEVAVLATCNRVEVYVATDGDISEAIGVVGNLLAARGQFDPAELMKVIDVRVAGDAAEHLFSVACGLESMAIGEQQIVAQIKTAARAAAGAGTAGPAILGLIDAALRVSKQARTETTISTAGISLARAGVGLAAEHLGPLSDRHAVVVGTGSMGKLAARLLREAGVGRLTIAGRDPARVTDLSAVVHGTPALGAEVAVAMALADILICASGSAKPVLHPEHLAEQLHGSVGRRRFVLDLGLPPNVDPTVGGLAGVRLVDLQGLGRHLAGAALPEQVPQVRALVAEAKSVYLNQQEQASAEPLIAAMHLQIRRLADAELERLQDRLPGLNDVQRTEASATVHRTLRKVLHGLTVRARDLATDANGSVHLEALRELFDLSPRDEITQSEYPSMA